VQLSSSADIKNIEIKNDLNMKPPQKKKLIL
jgi:hypothetical protein